mmetsp:Transcript_36508/g.78835  ORF Transcript_36508/g.78835 Transcript_36508/m.78835 type:complete len:276 (+) Transcript_36508:800-1627(+)
MGRHSVRTDVGTRQISIIALEIAYPRGALVAVPARCREDRAISDRTNLRRIPWHPTVHHPSPRQMPNLSHFEDFSNFRHHRLLPPPARTLSNPTPAVQCTKHPYSEKSLSPPPSSSCSYRTPRSSLRSSLNSPRASFCPPVRSTYPISLLQAVDPIRALRIRRVSSATSSYHPKSNSTKVATRVPPFASRSLRDPSFVQSIPIACNAISQCRGRRTCRRTLPTKGRGVSTSNSVRADRRRVRFLHRLECRHLRRGCLVRRRWLLVILPRRRSDLR